MKITKKKVALVSFFLIALVAFGLMLDKNYIVTALIKCPYKIEMGEDGVYNAFRYIDKEKISQIRQNLLEKDIMLKFDYEFNGNELKRESVFRDQKAAEDLLSSESFSIIKSSVEKAECSFEYKIQSGWFLQFSHTRVF